MFFIEIVRHEISENSEITKGESASHSGEIQAGKFCLFSVIESVAHLYLLRKMFLSNTFLNFGVSVGAVQDLNKNADQNDERITRNFIKPKRKGNTSSTGDIFGGKH